MRLRFLSLATLLILLAVGIGCASPDPRYDEKGRRVSLVYNYFVSPQVSVMVNQPVAVLPFDNWTGYIGADMMATDELNLQIGRTGMFRLVERLKVDQLFVEQDFNPSRIDQKHAVKIGRMLGAKAVILGTVYEFKPGNEPPKLGPRVYPFVIPSQREDMAEASLANGALFVLWALSNRAQEHDNAIGITVRMVDTETGEQLWQARDSFSYRDPRIEPILQNSYERWRAKRDVVLMNQLLCQELALTLTNPPPAPLRVGDPEGASLPKPEELPVEEKKSLEKEWTGAGGNGLTFNLVQGLNSGGNTVPWGGLPHDWLKKEF